MKPSLFKHTVLSLLLGTLLTPVQAAEEPSADALPHLFSNGALADADQVNANFEYLRNNVDLLVDLLVASQARIDTLESATTEALMLPVTCEGASLSDTVDPILDTVFPGEFSVPITFVR